MNRAQLGFLLFERYLVLHRVLYGAEAAFGVEYAHHEGPALLRDFLHVVGFFRLVFCRLVEQESGGGKSYAACYGSDQKSTDSGGGVDAVAFDFGFVLNIFRCVDDVAH